MSQESNTNEFGKLVPIPGSGKFLKFREAINGEFYYKVVAGNGETLVTSETHTRKENAIYGAMLLIEIMRKIWLMEQEFPKSLLYKAMAIDGFAIIDADFEKDSEDVKGLLTTD